MVVYCQIFFKEITRPIFCLNVCLAGTADPIKTPLQKKALRTLNTAVLSSSPEQRQALISRREQIIDLNHLVGSQEGMQVAVPQTKVEKVLELATRVFRIASSLLLDVLLLPAAGVLVLLAACKVNFDPKPEDVKKDKIPILLLHGSGFNEAEWIAGRQFLKRGNYGSVFSLNYDGLVTNSDDEDIETYTRENGKISEKIKEIKQLTGQNQVILIGHSLGGLIAGYYAEHAAERDEVEVKHVITLASPWQGTPMIDYLWRLSGNFIKSRSSERFCQLSRQGEGEKKPQFRQKLVKQALASEEQDKRKYYNIWSTTDYMVPTGHGNLTADPSRQRSFNCLGHYGVVIFPGVWLQVRSWLDEIYTQ